MAKNYYDIKEEAQTWLKDKTDEGRIVFKKSELPEKIYNYLKSNDFLVDLYSTYFFVKNDNEHPLEAFKLYYWKILIQFMNLRFPSEDADPSWYLTGKQSYEFLVDKVLIPELSEQLTFQIKSKSNTIIKLFDRHSLVVNYDKNFEEKTIVKKDVLGDDLFLLKPEYLIVTSSPTQYSLYEENIVSTIKNKDFDFDYVEDYFKKHQSPVYQSRFIGALKQLGENIQVIKFETLFKDYGFKIAIENPFSRDYKLKRSSKPSSVTRFALSMQKAKDYLASLNYPRRLNKPVEAIDIDLLTADDAYHSLTIEGYNVTHEIIQKLQNDEEVDSDLKNKTAAKGFIKVLSFVKTLIKTEFELEQDLTEQLWNELWSPSINAGLFDFEIDIYRRRPVFIRGSQSVPPSYEKIHYLLEEFYDQVNDFDNGIAQGIFAHFFYVWIHPHTDGNGRISRFLMNLALIKDKYKWLTIKVEDRKEYFAALEKSQINDDISYFAEFILKSYMS